MIAVVGAGLVGRRAATELSARDHEVVVVDERRMPQRLPAGVVSRTSVPQGASVVILATPTWAQPDAAAQLIENGNAVVSTSDAPADIRAFERLDLDARRAEQPLVVGAAHSPGLSLLVARWLANGLDSVDSISTASFGTGGPACARRHHQAIRGFGRHYDQGQEELCRAGSGRRLIWFPDPIGGVDCYYGRLAEPFLLHRSFPEVPRIRARIAATRRDRLTSRLPMLRPPHDEGLIGGCVVEVRGRGAKGYEHRLLASCAPQASVAAHTAAAAAEAVLQGRFDVGVGTMADVGDIEGTLSTIARSVPLFSFDGKSAQSDSTDLSRPARKPKRQ